MRKLVIIVVLMVFSANFTLAEEYRRVVVHRPGLAEAVSSIVSTAVALPFAVIGGVAQGLAGSEGEYYISATNTPGVAYNGVSGQPAYYYNTPMYSAAPFNPGYTFNHWYLQQNNTIVFVTNGQHRQHSHNHGGYCNGQRIHHKNNNHRGGHHKNR